MKYKNENKDVLQPSTIHSRNLYHQFSHRALLSLQQQKGLARGHFSRVDFYWYWFTRSYSALNLKHLCTYSAWIIITLVILWLPLSFPVKWQCVSPSCTLRPHGAGNGAHLSFEVNISGRSWMQWNIYFIIEIEVSNVLTALQSDAVTKTVKRTLSILNPTTTTSSLPLRMQTLFSAGPCDPGSYFLFPFSGHLCSWCPRSYGAPVQTSDMLSFCLPLHGWCGDLANLAVIVSRR